MLIYAKSERTVRSCAQHFSITEHVARGMPLNVTLRALSGVAEAVRNGGDTSHVWRLIAEVAPDPPRPRLRVRREPDILSRIVREVLATVSVR